MKRLFFAFKILAPWPPLEPKGRKILEEHRHLTVAFLGNIDSDQLLLALKDTPLPSIPIGLTGEFDKCLFLPRQHPTVVSWHIKWLTNPASLMEFQSLLSYWLTKVGYTAPENSKEWLPHVTLARQPFDREPWLHAFTPLPLVLGDLSLYESVGNLMYQPIWSIPVIPPFEEIEHTADLAFKICGNTLEEIFIHAQVALAFKFPELLPFITSATAIQSLDEIIMLLNALVCHVDAAIGCPFKAVSFHGDLKNGAQNTLVWEMIVDV